MVSMQKERNVKQVVEAKLNAEENVKISYLSTILKEQPIINAVLGLKEELYLVQELDCKRN